MQHEQKHYFGALCELVLRITSTRELRYEIRPSLPVDSTFDGLVDWTGPQVAVVDEVCRALERRGLIMELLKVLLAKRPGRFIEVVDVAMLWERTAGRVVQLYNCIPIGVRHVLDAP